MGTRTLALALGLGLALAVLAPAQATIVVPVDDADLIDAAASIIVGRVSAMQSHWDPGRQQIFTDITLSLDEVLAGPALPPTITIRQPGGRVGGLEWRIDGAPEFHAGEKALLFLRVTPDGTLRVAHLHQGKFRVIVEPETGAEIGVRLHGGQVRVLAPQRLGPPPANVRPLEELRRTIRALVARHPARQFLGATAPAPPPGAVQESDAFTFLGAPSRWFEPDQGQPVAMSVNADGEPRAPSRGFDQVRAGLRAWNDAGSSFRFVEGDVTTAAGNVFDGVNAITFGDPGGQIDPPVSCTGTLAQGGFFRSTTEARAVNGQSFWRVLEGDVVIADGWQGCGFYEVFANLAEVATHELGHVLGLGHSPDPEATMHAVAHFDGRGSSLRPDDRAGLHAIYPVAAPPSMLALEFTSPSSGATVSGRTTVRLAASGGSGLSYQVKLDGRVIFAGTAATFAWDTTAATNGAHTLAATVTDSRGRTATASIPVTVSNTAGGALRVAITQPRSGGTVRGTPWAVLWVDGTAGASNTFTLRLGGRVVGTSTTSGRGPVSMPYDTRTVADGTQPLTATVRDARGSTGSATVTVNVANGGAPAPPPPPPAPPSGALRVFLTSPRPSATVGGVVWVNIWVEGATGVSNVYTLSVDGATVATETSSRIHVTPAWDSRATGNGTRTLRATVRDASGKTGSASVTVTVGN